MYVNVDTLSSLGQFYDLPYPFSREKKNHLVNQFNNTGAQVIEAEINSFFHAI